VSGLIVFAALALPRQASGERGRIIIDSNEPPTGPTGVPIAPIAERILTPVSEPDKGRVLVVEDEDIIRQSLGSLLEDDGYTVSFAENGRQALMRLYTELPPDIIVLDLRMPVMNGWEFRTIQQDDPKLALIPVVAISADGSEQAVAISAQAYLRKPFAAQTFLRTIERLLVEKERQRLERSDEVERLISLGRLAAGVVNDINNPLAVVMLNLRESIERLRCSSRATEAAAATFLPEVELEELKNRLGDVAAMLEDCRIGGERIGDTVSHFCRRPDDSQH
jgi:CheY-like chemotaxis protein